MSRPSTPEPFASFKLSLRWNWQKWSRQGRYFKGT